jgi:formiminoglutamase
MELVVYDHLRINEITRTRVGETRLGEKVKTISWDQKLNWQLELAAMPQRYVLLGLPEDIGVRANFGRGGAYSAWQPALSTLLNIQSNARFTGEELIVLGHVDFTTAMEEMKHLDVQNAEQLQRAREIVSEIDDTVFPILKAIFDAGKEAIIIGGGHNNGYGLLKGLSLSMQTKSQKEIGCINCDAHSDLRRMEGRHSGNAFSYAIHDDFLQRYSIIGLHEIFNISKVMEDLIHNNKLQATWFEEIFVREEITFQEAMMKAVHFTKGIPIGLELDFDIIQNIPSSAKTSSGISTIQARQYVHWVATNSEVKYFHLTEAAPILSHIKTDLKTGKLIAYLVSDYIKARNQIQPI